jgi:prefoldin subunit 5
MAMQLYGCGIPDPPTGVTDPQQILDYYSSKLTECAKNPKPGSLAAQLNDLLKDYAKYSALAANGDAGAIAVCNKLSADIEALQLKMANLVALRGSRRKRAEDNTTDKGGTLENLGTSIIVLAAVSDLGKVEISLGGGVSVTPGLSAGEQKAADDTKAKNDATDKKAKAALGYIFGSGAALQTLSDTYSLPSNPEVLGQIQSNKDVAFHLLVPEVKKSSFPWLWLILGGAVAYSQSKK